MNETRAATMLAAALQLEAAVSEIDFEAAGSEADLSKPAAIVTFENFEEHGELLGNYEGTISVRLMTMASDTTLAEHRSHADEILTLLCDSSFMTTALTGFFKVEETWNPKRDTPETGENEREAIVMVTANVTQLA